MYLTFCHIRWQQEVQNCFGSLLVHVKVIRQVSESEGNVVVHIRQKLLDEGSVHHKIYSIITTQ
jgi:hypothetical protein